MMRTVRRYVKILLGYDRIEQKNWEKRNPYLNTPYAEGFIFKKGEPVITIFADKAHEHANYIKACIEMEQNYKVLDPSDHDWIKKVQESDSKAFMIWPTIYSPILKQFWDERIYTLKFQLKKNIFPSFDALWLYESKRKSLIWLEVNKLPHPDTKVFFKKEDALEFVKTCKYPIISKTDQGASANGVYILKTPAQAKAKINQAFKKGITLKNKGLYDRHQGYIIFQEYLPNCNEWRIIRVGDSYFCRFKIRVGEFHSGSGDIEWAKPPQVLLDMTREISEKFEIPNINVDFFETTDGRFMINEIHALWGGKEIHHPDLEGRYLYNQETGEWSFEKGDFFRNRCANLRIEWVRNNWLYPKN
jgi:hypothetical protein